MNRLDLELKLKQLDASNFQRLCDYLLSKLGFNIVPYGNCEGKNVVRKGTPDSYILNEDEKRMIFVEYTAQINDIGNKIIDDVQKCLEKKEKFKEYKLDTIFYFVNSNNIDPQKIDKITGLCNENNIEFKLYNQFKICDLLCHYKSVIKEIFGEMLEDDLLISLDDFIDYTKVLKGVDHSFQFIERNDEEKKIEESISSKIFTVISGEPGVGKSMLAVQILKKHSNNVVCVRKSNENALDYVFEKSNCLDNLTVFIDDINEVSSLKRFVDLFSSNKNNKIKIVCTVRNYALALIKNVVELYSFSYSIIEVNRVSKDVVKQIIEKNLSIKNSKLLEKIADISRGNPRLAIMAGKVVLSDGAICLQNSKDIVKKYFEISTNDAIKKIIDEHLIELCFIAFMKNVEINNLSSYSDVFKLLNIDAKKLKDSITILNSFEVISIYEDAVVQIDDQNLSDYILGKYFIDLKCCSISDLIVKLIRTRRNQIVECINIILNICSDESSRIYVKNEALKAWNILEGASDYDYFIQSFYLMNIDKSLIFYDSKIKNFYKRYTENFEVYDSTYGRNEVVDIVTDICKHSDSYSAFQLLLQCLDYDGIRNYAFDSVVSFAILKEDNFIYCGIKNDLIFKLKDYKEKPWFDFLLYSLLKEALKFSYEYTRMSNRNEVGFCTLTLSDDYLGIESYRKKLWELSFMLSDKRKYELIISYEDTYPSDKCKKIFRQDIKMITQVLESIKERNVLKEQLFKVQMLSTLKRNNIDLNALKIASENDFDKLIFIINPYDSDMSYEENQKKQEMEIIEYTGDTSVDEIRNILLLCDKISVENSKYSYKIKNFLELLFAELTADKLNELLNVIMRDKFSCDIKCRLLYSNYKAGNKTNALNYLFNIENDFDMVEATFYLFNSIPESEINFEMKKHFDNCFKLDLKNDKKAIRRIDVLYKFFTTESEFVDSACELNKIKEKNPNKFNSWIEFLFNTFKFEPKRLVEIFNKNKKIKALEEIILYAAHIKTHKDDLHEYVFEIAKIDEKILNIIVDNLFDNKENYYELLAGIWEREDSTRLANIIFDRICTFKEKSLLLHIRLEYIFIPPNYSEDDKNKFLIWANKKIENITDENSIKILTCLVSNFSGELFNQYYKTLVLKLINTELFDEILSYPLSCSWVGSVVNVYHAKANKFKKIISSIPDDLKYLDYRNILENNITNLENLIRSVRIKDKINSIEE